jgi:hypothetical protein
MSELGRSDRFAALCVRFSRPAWHAQVILDFSYLVWSVKIRDDIRGGEVHRQLDFCWLPGWLAGLHE